MMLTNAKAKYDENKFNIISNRHGVTVLYDGAFWENADSYTEALKDIKAECGCDV